MNAMTTALLNTMTADYEGIALSVSEAIEAEDTALREREEEYAATMGWACYADLQEAEEALCHIRGLLEECARTGDREEWYALYDSFSDLSKDVYGFRMRLPFPFSDDGE